MSKNETKLIASSHVFHLLTNNYQVLRDMVDGYSNTRDSFKYNCTWMESPGVATYGCTDSKLFSMSWHRRYFFDKKLEKLVFDKPYLVKYKDLSKRVDGSEFC